MTEPLTLRQRSPWLVRSVWLLGLVVVAAVVGYVTTHAEALPTDERVVTAESRLGTPVFVGVFEPGAGFDRTLEVSGVKVYATSSVPVTITPHLCRGGSVGATTDPQVFCSEVVATEGATLHAGDSVVLEVVGDEPGAVAIDRVRIAYREGFRWVTQRAGRPAEVTILGS